MDLILSIDQGNMVFGDFVEKMTSNNFYQSSELYHEKNFPFAGHLCGK
jgi:hypothetical protein